MRYNAFREPLRAARREKGLTQAGLAARSGTSRVTIARLEAGSAGDVRVGTIASLCEALGLEIAAVQRVARRALPEHALGLRPGAGRSVKREDLRRLFARARDLCGETDYVVFGSLAVLGYAGEVRPRMAASLDVDANFLDAPESVRARKALEEDRRWLRAKVTRRR